MVSALAISAIIHSLAYPLANDRYLLEQAISGASQSLPFERHVYAAVLEVRETPDGLAAFFRDKNNSHMFGFAFFERGLTRRYRLVEYQIEPMRHSAFVAVRSFRLGGDSFFLAGYNTV